MRNPETDTTLLIYSYWNSITAMPFLPAKELATMTTLFLITSVMIHAIELNLQSYSLRARVSEKTVLGKVAPEDFKSYDISANYELPWNRYKESKWGFGSRLMVSAGLLHGANKDAVVVSAVPELTFGTKDGRFVFDMGAGGALISRNRFGIQDFGGTFQFALTAGVTVPLYDNVGIGYRFMHYSDAGLWGNNTTGADFHMVEMSYRF